MASKADIDKLENAFIKHIEDENKKKERLVVRELVKEITYTVEKIERLNPQKIHDINVFVKKIHDSLNS